MGATRTHGDLPEVLLARSVAAGGGPAHPGLRKGPGESAEGRDLPLRLDLLVPETPGAKPLVVFLSGGGFVLSRKEATPQRRAYVAEAGYAVASIEYRTGANGATYRDAVADAKPAIRFLRPPAEEYGLDTSRVAVW